MKEKFKNWIINNWLKVVVITMLLWALADNPYGYYQFLRWAILAVGSYTTYSAHRAGDKVWPWIFGAIVILFNPIFLITFSRETWQIIDVVVAMIFFMSLFKKNNK